MQYLHSNQRITGGKIVESEIDGCSITNLPNPIQPTDAVNKQYVDGLSSSLSAIMVPLIGTDDSLLSNQKTGNWYIKVNHSTFMSGAPMLTSFIAKNDALDTEFAQVDLISLHGKVTGESIIFKWESNSNLYISKTGTNYDGTYSVTII